MYYVLQFHNFVFNSFYIMCVSHEALPLVFLIGLEKVIQNFLKFFSQLNMPGLEKGLEI
jgi:hypothetical protein